MYDIDFSPNVDALDGKNFLSSCSADKTVKLWDLQEGRLMFTMSGHEYQVASCKFSPHGSFLCSGGSDSKVFIWNSGLSSQYVPSPTDGAKASSGAKGAPQTTVVEKLETAPANNV